MIETGNEAGTGGIDRRTMVGMLAGALFGAGTAFAAPTYPDRALKMLVGYTPGGATDVIARVLAPRLAEALGQPVVVENRAGASGNLAAAAVAREKPDGYTLLMGAMTTHTINSILMGQAAQFDIAKSFAPITIVGRVPLVIVVNPNSKAQTLRELIELAKASPGQLNFATAGNGSVQHLATAMFERSAGVTMKQIPYKGSSPALTDLMGGQLDVMIDTLTATQAFIKGGKLKALAITTLEPVDALPGVKPASTQGLPGFEVTSMFGVAAPAGTPEAVVSKLNTTLKTILEQPEVRAALLAQGASVAYTSPQGATDVLKAEHAKWSQVIKQGNIKSE